MKKYGTIAVFFLNLITMFYFLWLEIQLSHALLKDFKTALSNKVEAGIRTLDISQVSLLQNGDSSPGTGVPLMPNWSFGPLHSLDLDYPKSELTASLR